MTDDPPSETVDEDEGQGLIVLYDRSGAVAGYLERSTGRLVYAGPEPQTVAKIAVQIANQTTSTTTSDTVVEVGSGPDALSPDRLSFGSELSHTRVGPASVSDDDQSDSARPTPESSPEETVPDSKDHDNAASVWSAEQFSIDPSVADAINPASIKTAESTVEKSLPGPTKAHRIARRCCLKCDISATYRVAPGEQKQIQEMLMPTVVVEADGTITWQTE